MNVDKQKQALQQLPLVELRERYAVCYGYTSTTKKRAHLVSKILWATQRDALGDISEKARKKALAIADDRDVRERFPQVQRPDPKTELQNTQTIAYLPKPELLPGTVLHRNYQGEDIRVLVLENGFEWNGERYRSLSAVARAVTGTRWNGLLFFGLRKGGQ